MKKMTKKLKTIILSGVGAISLAGVVAVSAVACSAQKTDPLPNPNAPSSSTEGNPSSTSSTNVANAFVLKVMGDKKALNVSTDKNLASLTLKQAKNDPSQILLYLKGLSTLSVTQSNTVSLSLNNQSESYSFKAFSISNLSINETKNTLSFNITYTAKGSSNPVTSSQTIVLTGFLENEKAGNKITANEIANALNGLNENVLNVSQDNNLKNLTQEEAINSKTNRQAIVHFIQNIIQNHPNTFHPLVVNGVNEGNVVVENVSIVGFITSNGSITVDNNNNGDSGNINVDNNDSHTDVNDSSNQNTINITGNDKRPNKLGLLFSYKTNGKTNVATV